MKVAVIAATCLVAVLTTSAFAAEPKAFVCKFAEGNSAKYEAGWSMKTLNEKMDFTFAGLDPQQGKAQLIGDVGASGVRFWKGAWTWNFVEVTDSGNVMTTTVFDAPDGESYPRFTLGTRPYSINRSPLNTGATVRQGAKPRQRGAS